MIAIHDNNGGFTSAWVHYLEKHGIPYKLVNCYDSRLIDNLVGCSGIMWYHSHSRAADQILAKRILFALEHAGIPVFPNFKTAWYFDDKVAQKYLFESLDISHAKSYIFISYREALRFVRKAKYPLIFKLSRGAGSKNVKKIDNKFEAFIILIRAFTKGFRSVSPLSIVKDKLNFFWSGNATLQDVTAAVVHLFWPYEIERAIGRERGYVYFQDYIEDCSFDVRVVVVGDKAFAIKRFVRQNDFRASGSGLIEFDKDNIPTACIEWAFIIADKIGSDCIAIDFVMKEEMPLVIEVGYGFNLPVYYGCKGYWDKNLTWHLGTIDPGGWMVRNFLQSISVDED